MKRLLLTALTALTMSAADGVLVTPSGKSYHQNNKCMALSRAKEIHTVTEEAAKGHGLKQCGICYRAKTEKKAKKDKSDWMKESAK